MLTWYSVTLQSASLTRWSLIQAEVTPRKVLVARSRPCRRASSKLFAGFEVRHGLARHSHLTAGTRVAPDPLPPPTGGEGAEAAQLDPRSSRQGRANLLEHRVHDPLHVAQVEMRVGGGQSLDQLGLAHAFALGCQAECAGRRRRVYLNSWILGISISG